MTKEQFIERYARNTGVDVLRCTDSGVVLGDGTEMVARSCLCGEEDCPGWQMLFPGESWVEHLPDREVGGLTMECYRDGRVTTPAQDAEYLRNLREVVSRPFLMLGASLQDGGLSSAEKARRNAPLGYFQQIMGSVSFRDRHTPRGGYTTFVKPLDGGEPPRAGRFTTTQLDGTVTHVEGEVTAVGNGWFRIDWPRKLPPLCPLPAWPLPLSLGPGKPWGYGARVSGRLG